eukprot:jgi/Astpho2/9417/Aster-x0853
MDPGEFNIPSERPDDCMSRTINGTVSSFVAGRIMLQYGGTFGAVGLAFTGVDCLAETIREKKDMWNGVLGGATAGAVLGLRIGRLPVAVGAAAALAATSAVVDTTGQSFTGRDLFDDGQTPNRVSFPYPVHLPKTPLENEEEATE